MSNARSLPSTNRPMVTVVITCYNYGHYLAGCLKSVLAQSFTDYEIILVDDGSTDDSDLVVQPFLVDHRLRYIKQVNGGQANAKNRGVKEARGEFIAFLDADDLWEPDKIEKQLTLFRNSRVGVGYTRQRFIDEAGNSIQRPRRPKTMQPQRGQVTYPLFMDNFVPFSSSMVRAECFKTLGCFDESLAMGIDWDLWLRFSTRYTFDYLDEPLLIYRIGHSGQMSKNTLMRQACSDRIMDKFRKAFPGKVPPSLDRKAMAFTYCNRGAYFRQENLMKSTRYYLMALQKYPLWPSAYKGLLKNGMTLLLPDKLGG